MAHAKNKNKTSILSFCRTDIFKRKNKEILPAVLNILITTIYVYNIYDCLWHQLKQDNISVFYALLSKRWIEHMIPSSGSLKKAETRGSLEPAISSTTHSWMGSLFLSSHPLVLYWTWQYNCYAQNEVSDIYLTRHITSS